MSLTRIALLFVLAIWLTACASQSEGLSPDEQAALQPSVNELTALNVSVQDGRTDLMIESVDKPIYSVFRMSDPQRLVVDFDNAVVKEIPSITEVNDGLLTLISTNQFKEGDKSVTRVMIGFAQDAEFSVSEQLNGVTLHLVHPEGYAAEAVTEEPVIAEAAPVVEQSVIEEAPVVEPAVQPVVPVACNPDQPVIEMAYDGVISKGKLTSVTLTTKENGVQLKANVRGSVKDGSIEVMRLCEPDRIVVDLYGIKNGIKSRKVAGDGEYISGVRVGSHRDKLRLVLDLKRDLQELNIDTGKAGLILALDEVVPQAVTVAKVEQTEPAAIEEKLEVQTAKEEQAATVSEEGTKVVALDFKHRTTGSTIEIRTTGNTDYRLVETADDQVVLELPGALLPEQLEQSLDTSEFNGPVSLVSSYVADPESKLVKIVAQTRYASPNSVTVKDNVIRWNFEASQSMAASEGEGRIRLAENGETVIEYEPAESAGMQQTLAPVAGAATAAQPAGQRISLELKNTDILDVLRLIADVSKLNIITSDNVSGAVTVRLLNVPWQQALDIILRSKGLGKERQGNIIRVAPLDVLQREREMRINQMKAQRELEPLSVRLIPISYAEAGSLIPQIKDLLSNRGTVNFDQRTNVIIVKDIDEVLSKAESMVSKLDLQTPQVMIEAKIVEADITNEDAFGIQWGGFYQASEATGNPTGLAFPYNLGVTGSQNPSLLSTPGVASTTSPPDWVVNTPTTTAPAAGLGFTFGSVRNAANLTLRLTAAASAGKIRIISSPRISTLDNTEATIEQGLRIPILSISISGVPVSKMILAKLQLTVTPHITADGSIIMKLNILKEEPDFSRTNSLGDPAIITKKAKTEVLVRTGETTVIGGIYTKKTTEKDIGVPLLYKIPILGWLFKSHTETEQKTELLIFVTPRIINRSQSSLVAD